MKRQLSLLIISLAMMVAPFGAGIRPPAGGPDEAETDPLVLAKLARRQDWKFGLMMHWGPYSQWGVVESWTLCSEDESWRRRSMANYVEYKKAYEALPRTFNPAKFDPAKWAAAAKAAGMRYVVFTTKHHDGFAMFDTKETGYRVTSNKSFESWAEMMGDSVMTTALLDRLLHHARVFTLDGESCRIKKSRKEV